MLGEKITVKFPLMAMDGPADRTMRRDEAEERLGSNSRCN